MELRQFFKIDLRNDVGTDAENLRELDETWSE